MSDNILQAVDNLTAAVAALTAAQQNTNIILNATATSSCYCVIGSAPDGEAGVEGGAPPPPIGDIVYDDLDPQVADRKCKAADYIVTWLIDELFYGWLIAHNIKELTGIGLALALGATGAWIGTTVGPAGTLVGAIAGLILGAMTALIGTTLDIDQTAAVMDAHRQELICALYGATDVDEARAAFQQILINDGGLSDLERNFVDIWMPNAFLNMLFFDVTIPIDTAVYFDGYAVHTGCDCGPADLDWVFMPINAYSDCALTTALPTLGGTGTILNNGDQFTVNSVTVNIGGTNYEVIALVVELYRRDHDGISYDTGPLSCGGGQLEVVSWSSLTNMSSRGHRVSAACVRSGCNINNGVQSVGLKNDRVAFEHWRTSANGAFSVTLKVVTPPTVLC